MTELLATLEPDVPAERRTDEEWIAEIERRARVALEGRPSVSGADARRRIQKRLSDE